VSKHIVCLTFDFDALSLWIARGMTSPTPISRGEFGAVGAVRILELLERFAIPGTWFVPGLTIETYPEICRRIHEEGHEIGHHGWAHVPPAKLSRAEEETALVRGSEAIAEICGRSPQGYRSPAWDLSPHTVELLLAHDFLYDSSMMGHDYFPYRARRGDQIHTDKGAEFGPPTALVEMPVSWSLDDFPHFEFLSQGKVVLPGLAPAGGVEQNWYDDFAYMRRFIEWGVFTLTCHPFVIGRGHRMLMLERLIERLAADGAEFMTMAAAAQAFAARTD